MITVTIDEEKKHKPVVFPKLMRGTKTGAIYLAHKEDRFYMTTEVTTLFKGDSSDPIGARNKYESVFLEDYNGSLTIRNVL